MKTAFVYSIDDGSKNDLDIATAFDGTAMQYTVDHVVFLQADKPLDDLNEFHDQVVEYANANLNVEVYFLGLDLTFIRRIVFELLALGAAVIFKLTPTQRDFIWSRTA